MTPAIAAGSRLASTRVRTRDGTRVVDLRDVSWVDPVHLVAVAAEAHAARRDGLGFTLRGPSAPDRARYAARMRLGELVAGLGGTHDLPPVNASDRTGELVEVAELRAPRDVRQLAELVATRVDQLDRELAQALHQGVSEIGENVCIHARSVGFVAAQTIPRRGELRFAVADPGVGLLATLRPKGALDHRNAIELALQGVSSRNRRGTGLRSTVDAVTHLDGYVYLASGDAATVVRASRTVASAGAAFAGTIVEGRVPTRGLVRRLGAE